MPTNALLGCSRRRFPRRAETPALKGSLGQPLGSTQFSDFEELLAGSGLAFETSASTSCGGRPRAVPSQSVVRIGGEARGTAPNLPVLARV